MTKPDFWRSRRVLVTGHTGFKGSWLSAWLLRLGADVHGIALPPDFEPSLFVQLGLEDRMASRMLDIRDSGKLEAAVREIAPDVVFHLAAQPLVRESYAKPLSTWSTNVMGTANLLQAVSVSQSPCAIVVVTTDKVYRNNEWVHTYRETDRLGGHDPYSASKAATELLIDSWRASFLSDSKIRLASARAGNVIGGGDWSHDRILPDLVRARSAGETLTVRNPESSRPWQHVLEPLDGYMTLARHMIQHAGAGQEAWNFGPDPTANRSVRELVEECGRCWDGAWRAELDDGAPHEAGRLALSTSKARTVLGWAPAWGFEKAVKETISWYRAQFEGECSKVLCENQIALYEASR